MMSRHFLLFLFCAAFAVRAVAAPLALNDKRTIPLNSSVTINALNNDSDPNGFPLKITTVTKPAHGTATVRETDSGITYVPDANFTGVDQFTYRLVNIPTDQSLPEETTGTIIVEVVAFAGAGQGANEQSVGQALESICGRFNDATPSNSEGANTDSNTVINLGEQALRKRCLGLLQLRATNSAGLNTAINEITPEETLALMKAATGAAQGHSNTVSSHLSNLTNGGGSALSLNGTSWQSPWGGAAGDEVKNSPWSIFASAQLVNADKKKTAFENGFESDANTLVAGLDYSFAGDWVLGAAGGFTSGDLTYANADGTLSSDLSSLIVYGLYNLGNFSWDAQVGTSHSSYTISRHVHYAEADGSEQVFNTHGETQGQQVFASTQVQYTYNYKALSLYPSIKLSLADNQIDAYGEGDAGGFEVNLSKQKTQRTDLTASLSAQYALNFSWGVLVPNGNVSLISGLSSKQDKVQGVFAFGPLGVSGFSMQAEDSDDSYYQAALGANLVMPKGMSAFVNYQETLGYENLSTHQLEGGVRVEF